MFLHYIFYYYYYYFQVQVLIANDYLNNKMHSKEFNFIERFTNYLFIWLLVIIIIIIGKCEYELQSIIFIINYTSLLNTFLHLYLCTVYL